MKRINTILVVASVLVSVSQCFATEKFSTTANYLDLPDLSSEPEYHQKVRDAMIKLQLGSIERIEKEDVVEAIQKASAESKSEEEKQLYQTLNSLFIKDDRVSDDLVKLLKSVVAQTEPLYSSDELVKFKIALKITESFKKLKDIAGSISAASMLNDPKVRLLDSFDRVFSKALILNEGASHHTRESFNENLLNKLKEFDLATDNLNAKKMIKAAGSKASLLVHSKNRVFKEYMTKKCDKLEVHKHSFDVINLIRSLGYWRIKFSEVDRLNEYHRICLAWKDTDKQEQIVNHVLEALVESGQCSKHHGCLPF